MPPRALPLDYRLVVRGYVLPQVIVPVPDADAPPSSVPVTLNSTGPLYGPPKSQFSSKVNDHAPVASDVVASGIDRIHPGGIDHSKSSATGLFGL